MALEWTKKDNIFDHNDERYLNYKLCNKRSILIIEDDSISEEKINPLDNCFEKKIENIYEQLLNYSKQFGFLDMGDIECFKDLFIKKY